MYKQTNSGIVYRTTVFDIHFRRTKDHDSTIDREVWTIRQGGRDRTVFSEIPLSVKSHPCYRYRKGFSLTSTYVSKSM